MNNNLKPVEILAPCGSYDILVAAVKAGADACYIGGNKFGARAYAANLSDDSIIAAIDYAHIHNVKLYLTVNTLFKNQELQELYDYLAPYYEGGIDAVIVQDLGAFKFIKDTFPKLAIHCSTQMNITSIHGAEYMKSMGASRIVTPREMSLSEIKSIKDKLDIEIESFVHGAMCYSYSGQCLMSSMAGNRSGNRGRCAQPCRKKYNGNYILSMKDMCTLDIIPDIIEAGIDSLKIEGRMKNEYYVASAVSAYKELTCDYYSGCYSNNKADRFKERLASIYNRGGFCQGYYFVHNDSGMISKSRPNNQGVLIGRLCSADKGMATLKLSRDLNCHDVLEFKKKDNSFVEVCTGKSGIKGQTVSIKVPDSKYLVIDQSVYRTKCNKLIEEINDNIIKQNKRIPVKGRLVGQVGKKLSLCLCCHDSKITVYSERELEKSQSSSYEEKDIVEKLSMLGNTYYYLDGLEMQLDNDVFIPASVIKKLRRDAIDMLTKEICQKARRKPAENSYIYNKLVCAQNKTISPGVHAGIRNIEQLKEILNFNIQYIYIQRRLYDDIISLGIMKKLSERNINIYIELPDIIRNDFDLMAYLPDEIYGIYINNIDGFSIYMKNYNMLKDKQVVLGSCLYAYNDIAREFLHTNNNISFENPKELRNNELLDMNNAYPCQLTIYEYQRVMISAQCVIKNKMSCTGNNKVYTIKDDRGNRFFALSDCMDCHGIIYNGFPTSLIGKIPGNIMSELNVNSLKINFTIENKNQVAGVLNHYFEGKDIIFDTTTGHFFRGVE